MKKLLMFVLFVFWSLPTFAQVDTAWVRRYNGPGNGQDHAYAIAVDGSGNVYVTGYSLGSGTNYDYTTIKYYPNGDTAWVRRYNGGGNGEDLAYAIALDDSGNVYVTGWSHSGYTKLDWVTLKYYSNGDTAWLRRYGGPYFEDRAFGIAVDGFGNVYVTGRRSRGSNGWEYATIKYYPTGDTMWVRRYNGPGNSYDWATAIAIDASGNVCVTGYSRGSAGYDYATIKYYANGDTAWVRRYNGPGNDDDWGQAIAVDGAGNVYVTGYSYGSGTYGDYATIKYHPNGDTAWVRRYNGPGNSEDRAFAIALDDSGSCYVTGWSYGSESGYDYATIKYYHNGDTAWVRRYNGPGDGEDWAWAVAVDGFGNAYVTGGSVGSSTDKDYATVKYDASGNVLWIERYNGPGNDLDRARAVAVNGSGDIYVTGRSEGSGTYQDYATIKYVQSEEYQPFYFVHITDPHVWFRPLGYQRWWDILDTIKTWNPPPDFVLCSGDLVHFGAGVGAPQNWDKLLEPLDQTEYGSFYLDPDHTIPIYFCPGNHDAMNWTLETGSFENYYTYVGPDYYLRLHKSCVMFSMNSGKNIYRHSWPDPPEGDGLDDYYTDEVTWLLNNLDALDGEYNGSDNSEYCKIIMMHHPYKNPNGDTLDGVFWKNRDTFINACIDFDVDAVVCGHLHDSGSISNSDAQPWQEGNGTRFIITNAIAHDLSYRKIYISPTGEIEEPIINGHFRSTISGKVACRTVMHIYDDKGNHDGPDENGDIEILIPGSYYSYWVVDTLGINATFTEFSLYKEDTTDYTLTIESLSNDSMNISLFTTSVSGLSSEATYTAVPVDSGSVATLYAYGSEFDYTLYIDDDGDGVPDREIRPDSEPYYCGDANGDGQINLADAVYLVNYLFIGGPPPEPLEAGDANCDGEVDLADAVYIINYLFIGGPPPSC